MKQSSDYHVAYEPDLRCYPNYSFEIGDIDGDGRMEFVSLNQPGNRLRAVDLDGRVVFETRLKNNGNWGSPLVAVADLDGDGRAEVAAPTRGRRRMSLVHLFDAKGEVVAEYAPGTAARDDYGIGVPLLAPFRCTGRPGLVAAIAGGSVVALDSQLREIWRTDGFRNDFCHEFHVADMDGDGRDEVAFCTVDHINLGYVERDYNIGELIILDHDGSVILRERVDRYVRDTHFDDLAAADFRGVGETELLLEKGVLINLKGEVVWDASALFDHGQWIAHLPDPAGKGRRIVISELWGKAGKSAFLTGAGELVATVRDLPRTAFDPAAFPGWSVLPTRCHVVQWTPDAAPEIFIGEQACSPISHNCFATVGFELKAFFLDPDGRLIGVMPFGDSQIEGYWYNGEVHSRVADVDGDGCQEVVFPRQDGRVMVIKKRSA